MTSQPKLPSLSSWSFWCRWPFMPPTFGVNTAYGLWTMWQPLCLSSTQELDLMSGSVHAVLCGLGCATYFEWVQSADNWRVLVLVVQDFVIHGWGVMPFNQQCQLHFFFYFSCQFLYWCGPSLSFVCVCHTHGGLETQALQDAAGGSLLGQQTTNALSRRILARSELVYEKDAWQLLLSSLL